MCTYAFCFFRSLRHNYLLCRLKSKIPNSTRPKMSASPNATLAVDPVTVSTAVFCYFNLCVSDPTVREYDVRKNMDFNITCTMNEPVTWIHPKHERLSGDEARACELSTHNITDAKLPDGRYQSTFIRNRACYLDTGFYLCTTSAERHEEGYYIYVNDEEHPIFGILDLSITRAYVLTNVLVPCKPTSSKIKPLLTVEGSQDEVQIAFKDAEYDPHRGFVLSQVHLIEQGFYHCQTEDKKYTLSWFLEVIAMLADVDHIFIHPINAYHANVGDTVVLDCQASVGYLYEVDIVWMYPNESLKPFIIEGMRRNMSNVSAKKYVMKARNITLVNLTKSFEGSYTCRVDGRLNSENVSYYLVVHDENSAGFLSLSVRDGDPDMMMVSAGTPEFKWIVDVISHPRANISWSFQGHDIPDLENEREYTVDFDGRTAKLGMRNVTIDDGGSYTITADTGQEKSQRSVMLFVKDRPRIKRFQLNETNLVNMSSRVEAIVSGFPRPEIRWYASRSCEDPSTCRFKDLPLESHVEYAQGGEHFWKSVLTIRSNFHLILIIYAQNDIGNSTAWVYFNVTDVPERIELSATPQIAEEGDEINLICRACGVLYKGISWSFRGSHSDPFVPAERIAGILTQNTTTSISLGETLRIPNATKTFGGQYQCDADPNDPSAEKIPRNKSITIGVNEPIRPSWNSTNMGGTTKTETQERLTLECMANGFPTPEITWLKNEAPLSLPPGDTRVSLRNSNQTLLINYAVWSDEGKYTCIAANKVGVISVSQVIQFTDKPKDHSNVYMSIAIVSAIFIVICCVFIVRLVRRVRRERALRKELEATGLLNFEEGAVESLNPALGVEEQADLLPYDRQWEFPREKLSIGKQLGSGAFGTVMKAEAIGIVEEGTTTTVAVKMVKRGADPLHIRALASELKIMVHLGRHLNVVNLLGACTNDIRKLELVVIVEYCRYGNLHDFLLKRRKQFINQVNDRDELDFSITTLNKEDQYCSMSHGSSVTTSSNTGATSTGGADGHLVNTDCEPDPLLGSDIISHPVRTVDLISWSFQISCGMQYLAERRVLHGDLAARNVLLTDDNIVKICDFGLAKSMMYNNYQRRKHELLPVCWMAIESIRDRVVSVYSDVWSFGITMWELFSLSVTPYPGIEDFETLYHKLAAGYRLDRPKYAPREIYGIMMDCWREEPTQRPTFIKLSSRLNALLGESARSHYTNIGAAYQKINPIKDNDTDYLDLLNPHLIYAVAQESAADVPSGSSSCDEENGFKLTPLPLKIDECTNMNPSGVWVRNPNYAPVDS